MTELLNSIFAWVQANPQWALTITFFISLAESLAIIGTIVPGSVTMTAIGILAGSGVMRIDYTLIAACLGAIVGDALSYIIGFVFRSRIPKLWPFTRYPYWLVYGQEYFKRHGGKSVFFGRFIGPLRALIPVIAGMMHMNYMKFFIANVLSAIGWSIIYVMPGVFIGAASSELSEGSSKRLLLILFGLILALWIITRLSKYIYKRSRAFLKNFLITTWIFFQKHSFLHFLIKKLAPAHETKHLKTLSLIFLFLLCVLSFFILTIFLIQKPDIANINTSAYLLAQTLRFEALDNLSILLSFFTNNLTVLALFIIASVYFTITKNINILAYWIGVFCTSSAIFILLKLNFVHPNNMFNISYSFGALNICILTSLIIFMTNLLNHNAKRLIIWGFNFFIIILLASSILAQIYLGTIVVINTILAILAGSAIGLGFWIMYRRNYRFKTQNKHKFILALIVGVVCSIILSTFLYFNEVKKQAIIAPTQILSFEHWWHSPQSIPVFYTTNLSGKSREYINVQFNGSIDEFKELLINEGWREEKSSVLFKLFMLATGQKSIYHTPIFNIFYKNYKPTITMIYQHTYPIVLQLWVSDYMLKDAPTTEPLWFGVIYSPNKNAEKSLYKYLQPVTEKFSTKLIHKNSNKILLILESETPD